MKEEVVAKKRPVISGALKTQLAFDELISKYHKLTHAVNEYCQTKCPSMHTEKCAKCPLDVAGKEE